MFICTSVFTILSAVVVCDPNPTIRSAFTLRDNLFVFRLQFAKGPQSVTTQLRAHDLMNGGTQSTVLVC